MFGNTPRSLVGATLSALLLVSPANAQGTGSGSSAAKQGSKPAASTPKQAADDSTGELVEVTVTGKGATPKEAFDDAIRTALRQVAGTFVRTDSKVQDDQLVQDRIITHSQGFIEKATKKGAAKLKDGAYEQEAIVIVRVGKVEEVFTESAVSSTEIDGDSLAAKVRSLRENKASADELLAAVFEGFPANVMDCEIAPECTGDRLKPSAPPNSGSFATVLNKIDLGPDEVYVVMKVDIWVNERKWKAWAKAAEDAFKAVAIGGHTIKINPKKSGAKRMASDHPELREWTGQFAPFMSDRCASSDHLAWLPSRLAWEAWLDPVSREFAADARVKEKSNPDSLKGGLSDAADVGVVGVMSGVNPSGFASYAIPRTSLISQFPRGCPELQLDLTDASGETVGTLVPMCGTGRDGAVIAAQLSNDNYKVGTSQSACRPWIDLTLPTSPERPGMLLIPAFLGRSWSGVVLSERLTIPVGVILTEQELASLTKVEARLGNLIPDRR